ncbi:ABC transporter ATP-binding protein [Desulfomonile tiedjei]|uniref:ABC-type spermidine/putrescine transport system, ATPase component n=1 Tax=Desulfomonile tiedjei (strain ATCC 49306 / DSM 6799 / DCB-1) TaxID=706587 RepID=I4BZS8_DESTA|nr:ABC transporter ATP-binding protein [Desulfomonile tiedjei]AFM22819.1 ABC-type spermidine/putrescine transport system, ATPase component [Desulfomonile tiedjei DSM 6799]
MTPAYEIEGLTFTYGTVPVISLDRLEIPAGEIVGLVGPNGSGKTTLLHMLAFIEEPGQGDIRFFGQSCTESNRLALRRKVGLLLQNPYLFHSTVLSNLTWGLKIRDVPRHVAAEAALKALALVGLGGFEGRYARALSGGETQRVALARALVLDPEVLLLDEPANHMDKESIERTESIVSTLNREHGKTVILTSHNASTVQNLAHRILYVEQGRVVPASLDNLFSGNLVQDGSVFRTERISVDLPDRMNSGSRLVIDAQQIRLLLDTPEPDLKNVFSGLLSAMTLENGKIKVKVDAEESFQIVLEKSDPLVSNIRLGQRCWFHLTPSSIKVF